MCINAQRVFAALPFEQRPFAAHCTQSSNQTHGAAVSTTPDHQHQARSECGFADIAFTSADGLRLHARDYAGASGFARLPVICIHGLTRNCSDFDEVAPRIAALGRRVIAVDVRGRGLSSYDSDPSHYNPAVYAADVVKLMGDLGIARAVFIGTSMGGLITMTLALRHLDLIAAAVLNDVGPQLSPRGLARIAGYAGKGEVLGSWAAAAAYLRDINQVAFPDYGEADWAKWARRAFTETAPGVLTMRYDANIGLAVRSGAIKSSSMMANFAFKRLARRRPTLLIRGALSDLIEDAQVAHMRAMAPAMGYAEVARVGHAPMLTEPQAQAALREFLSKVE
jgi:pimeloyl-ACP methyl ester carboxylesterase